jgi:hypothetical protein
LPAHGDELVDEGLLNLPEFGTCAHGAGSIQLSRRR